jgi:hypothetical protein
VKKSNLKFYLNILINSQRYLGLKYFPFLGNSRLFPVSGFYFGGVPSRDNKKIISVQTSIVSQKKKT